MMCCISEVQYAQDESVTVFWVASRVAHCYSDASSSFESVLLGLYALRAKMGRSSGRPRLISPQPFYVSSFLVFLPNSNQDFYETLRRWVLGWAKEQAANSGWCAWSPPLFSDYGFYSLIRTSSMRSVYCLTMLFGWGELALLGVTMDVSWRTLFIARSPCDGKIYTSIPLTY